MIQFNENIGWDPFEDAAGEHMIDFCLSLTQGSPSESGGSINFIEKN